MYNGALVLIFTAGFILTLVLMVKNYDRIWYGGRAAAESAKTLAWKYAVRAAPFDAGTDREVDAQFVAALRSIIAQRDALAIVTDTVSGGGGQITAAMRACRASSLETRRNEYLTHRVDEQRRWYAERSAFNSRKEQLFFALVLASQGCAALYGVSVLVFPPIKANLSGFFATSAAGFLVWMQARQHQELAQSYAVASQELGLVLAQGEHVNTDESLASFVADAENAISREHTLWTARRDRLPTLAKV